MMDLDEVYNSTIKKTQSLLESKGIALSLREIKKLHLNYICLFNYLFISSQMSAKPYFIGSTGILLLW